MTVEHINQLYQQKRFDEAEQAAKQLLHHEPHNVDALYVFALVMQAQMQFAKALELILKLLELNPNHLFAHTVLTFCCAQLGLADLALPYLQRREQSNVAGEQSWLAGLYTNLAMYDKALSIQQAASLAHPDDPYAQYTMGTIQMAAGQTAVGMLNYRHLASRKMFRTFRQDLLNQGWNVEQYWEGESVVGKTILLFPVGGYGDYMQFCRYVKGLKALGAKRILGLVYNHRIHGLLRSCADLEIIDNHNGHEFDCWTDPFGLCAYLHPKFGYLAQPKYLTAPVSASAEELVQNIRIRAAGRRCIGLAWHSETHDAVGRNIPLANLLPLFGMPNVHWVIFQRGVALTEFQNTGLASLCTVVDEDVTFDEAAAIVSGLDGVASIDSFMTHLSGSIGQKVYFLAGRSLDWRHMNEETVSLWYPNTTIIRQPTLGDWRGVIQQLQVDLNLSI
ncbi:tetratricopeptide repeat protein [Hydromonas duriensis]|uniref:Anaphase-promoting complex subunit 3 n=1 Tax=Hydromonas duriensis TaxID=1527608 RepID=A0A4R6YAI2_9BURK|nr:tetratricopeptide repeat protein [Hydromonas duriensis]TDR32579.1 anaphase-promoting complex subunit 3 [Hydromonas duriensis]